MLEVDGSTVVLGVRASLAKRLAEERNMSVIAEGLAKVVGGTWQVVVTAAAMPAGTDEAPAPSPGRAAGAASVEPDPREDSGYEPAPPPAAAAPADPEAEAMKLLRDQLDARPLDG